MNINGDHDDRAEGNVPGSGQTPDRSRCQDGAAAMIVGLGVFGVLSALVSVVTENSAAGFVFAFLIGVQSSIVYKLRGWLGLGNHEEPERIRVRSDHGRRSSEPYRPAPPRSRSTNRLGVSESDATVGLWLLLALAATITVVAMFAPLAVRLMWLAIVIGAGCAAAVVVRQSSSSRH